MYKKFFSVFVFLLVFSMALVLAEQGLQSGGESGNKVMVESGFYMNNAGQGMMIQKQTENKIRLESGGVSADCDCEMTQEMVQDRTKLHVEMSNGMNAEIKVMPDVASETALTRLRLNVCSEENECKIELKEVGEGSEAKMAYEVQIERHSRILGMFQTKMQVRTQVDADSGEVVGVKKPWWAFIATEPAE